MNRNHWMALLLVGAAVSCKTKETGFSIHGQLTGIPSGGVKLVTYKEDDRSSKVIDSVPFSNGVFTIKGKLDEPQMLTVLIEPGGWSFQVFSGNEDVQITADTTGAEHYDYAKYGGGVGGMIKNYTVSGSKGQDEWMAFQHDSGQKKYDEAMAVLDTAFRAEKDIDKQYKIRDQLDSVHKLQLAWKQDWISRYINQHPSMAVGAYMMNDLYQEDPNMPLSNMETMLNGFTGEARSSGYCKRLFTALDKRKALLPGSPAPDFTLLKSDSSSFTLSSTRGKYMMIDFWASWCHPCRQAIPHWKEIYAKYHAKGFDIVSVSDDNRWTDWRKAMDQEKMPWMQVDDDFPIKNMPARVGTLYMTTYIPFYVLLDKEGKIILYTGNEEEIDARLKALLG